MVYLKETRHRQTKQSIVEAAGLKSEKRIEEKKWIDKARVKYKLGINEVEEYCWMERGYVESK